MTEHEDIRWVRSVVSSTDPLSYSEPVLEGLAAELRLQLQERIAGPDAPSPDRVAPDPSGPQVRRMRAARTARSPWMAAAAVAVALMVASAGLAAALPDPAWAVDQTGEGLVRIELSPVLGRGPDPTGLVEELDAVGVSVEAQEQPTWWPWHSGRIIGIGWRIDSIPEAFADGRLSLDADLSDVGILEHGDGSLVIDPKVFTGTVSINIGASPW